MTVRELYNNVLVELNKVQAPSLLLEDFVYLVNKAVQKYINKRYNFFEMNQQLTDDLRVLLKSSDALVESKKEVTNSDGTKEKKPIISNIDGAPQYDLPEDYMHILNCICKFEKPSNSKCSNTKEKQYEAIPASKLDTASWPHTIENYYMKPSRKRPYYYIINIQDPSINPNYPVDQIKGERYGNSQVPVIQIKSGKDKPTAVYVDYLRAPQYIDLTIGDLDYIDDNTPQLEFPDYVTYEIINELVTLILENNKDPRVQTQPAVSQSVIQPVGTSK